MKKWVVVALGLSVLTTGAAFSQQIRGFVLKRGEGERLFDGNTIVLASPITGTQSVEMFWQATSPGFSTGMHVHHDVDEFFYVTEGVGSAFVAGEEVSIASGDFIFVPRGEVHRVHSAEDGPPLEIVYLVDQPGLASEFRESHIQFELLGQTFTLEALNEISEPHGTTYLTVE